VVVAVVVVVVLVEAATAAMLNGIGQLSRCSGEFLGNIPVMYAIVVVDMTWTV